MKFKAVDKEPHHQLMSQAWHSMDERLLQGESQPLSKPVHSTNLGKKT